METEGNLYSSAAYRWPSSLSSPQVQVQALEHSSPRLRHVFAQNMPSYANTPFMVFEDSSSHIDGANTFAYNKKRVAFRSRFAFLEKAGSSASWYLAGLSWGSQFTWLCLYFSLNLFLTLSNKTVLTSFPFPYTLTAIHALCSTLGGLWLRYQSAYLPKRLDFRNELVLAAFSFLYSINIAVSNISLHLVTVPVSLFTSCSIRYEC
jgi:hypothetical protein